MYEKWQRYMFNLIILKYNETRLLVIYVGGNLLSTMQFTRYLMKTAHPSIYSAYFMRKLNLKLIHVQLWRFYPNSAETKISLSNWITFYQAFFHFNHIQSSVHFFFLSTIDNISRRNKNCRSPWAIEVFPIAYNGNGV